MALDHEFKIYSVHLIMPKLEINVLYMRFKYFKSQSWSLHFTAMSTLSIFKNGTLFCFKPIPKTMIYRSITELFFTKYQIFAHRNSTSNNFNKTPRYCDRGHSSWLERVVYGLYTDCKNRCLCLFFQLHLMIITKK